MDEVNELFELLQKIQVTSENEEIMKEINENI